MWTQNRSVGVVVDGADDREHDDAETGVEAGVAARGTRRAAPNGIEESRDGESSQGPCDRHVR